MKIIIISEDGYNETEADKTIGEIGQKARGLLSVPCKWTIPFACISCNVFRRYVGMQENDQNTLIHNLSNVIIGILPKINVSENDELIIRSSSEDEGIKERGRYESKHCSVSEMEKTLTELFSLLITEYETPPDMAFVIQRYVKEAGEGHFSNERRFSKDKRDWIYEYTKEGKIFSGNVRIRNWRRMPQQPTETAIKCKNESTLSSDLYPLAWYYADLGKAVHIEYIWDGEKIIIVQIDEETKEETSCDPTLFDIKIHSEGLESFFLLREVTEKDKKYAKISNVLLYKKIGLKTVPIYLLDNKEVLEKIKEKTIPRDLEIDLKNLIKCNSLVVRMDIANAPKEERQLLPRTNEVRNYEELKEWLFEQSPIIKKNTNIAFLFHIFVPARAAAFAKASPTNRIVEIEALWGLPEGLYYNSHDKIKVDTKSVDADIVNNNNIEILKKIPAYKEFCVIPNKEGEWKNVRLSRPHDWKLCISDEGISQIATESRKIAKAEGKEIDIMWFVDIDADYYGTSNLAWYHEEYSNNSYTTIAYKKKYFFEKESVISCKDDYEKFLKDTTIKQVKLKPRDEELLRDKEFITTIGNVAKERDVAIILEGAMLAHALYQLCRTGAKVLTPSDNAKYKEQDEFGKLVRDKIPYQIVEKGEYVICYSLEKNALLRALFEKATEEAIEIAKACTKESLSEEIADEKEVLTAITFFSQQVDDVDAFQFKTNSKIDRNQYRDNLIFKELVDLTNEQTEECISVGEIGSVKIDVSYEGTELQIDMRFIHGLGLEQYKKTKKLTESIEIEKLLCDALALSSEKTISAVCSLTSKMNKELSIIAKENKMTNKEIADIAEKKRNKKGGFKKGYMLKASSLSSDDMVDTIYSPLSQDEIAFKRVSLLDYNVDSNADYLDKGSGELVLRLSLPLCFNSHYEEFNNNSVRRFLGDKKAIVIAKRDNSKLLLSCFLEEVYSKNQLNLVI